MSQYHTLVMTDPSVTAPTASVSTGVLIPASPIKIKSITVILDLCRSTTVASQAVRLCIIRLRPFVHFDRARAFSLPPFFPLVLSIVPVRRSLVSYSAVLVLSPSLSLSLHLPRMSRGCSSVLLTRTPTSHRSPIKCTGTHAHTASINSWRRTTWWWGQYRESIVNCFHSHSGLFSCA